MSITASSNMVYLDNAATTWPKPLAVREAVSKALKIYGANPGRGGYPMSMAASEAVYRCREAAADFFHLENPENVIFVQNCTMALNTVLKSIVHPGERVVVSDLEHNAVMRPLAALSHMQPIYDIAKVTPGNPQKTVEAFRCCIRPNTRAIVCLHASNVFGVRLPIRELGQLAHRRGLLFVVDAAQSAGVVSIDMQQDGIDYLCVPGHKSLYGPMGTGLLLCNSSVLLSPLVQGGTGSHSVELQQPEELPDRLESGTLNVSGICGLHAGLEFVQKRGVEEIAGEEMRAVQRLYRWLSGRNGVRLYTPYPELSVSAPILSFNLEGRTSEDTAQALSKSGIAVRAGLHCAPSAHRRYGTLDTGTVRAAPSAFTTREDIDRLCHAIRRELSVP